jgi:hypothetical protein
MDIKAQGYVEALLNKLRYKTAIKKCKAAI